MSEVNSNETAPPSDQGPPALKLASAPEPALAPKWLALFSRWPTLHSILSAWSAAAPQHIARVKELPKTHLGFAVLSLGVVAILLVYVMSDEPVQPLPGCDDADVQEVVRNLVNEALTQDGTPTPNVEVSEFQSGGSAPSAERQLCTFSVQDRGEKLTMYMSVSWKDASAAEYQVEIGSTYDAVSR